MNVSVAQAKNQLPKLIRAFEQGETVVITRNGKPVAQLAPPPPERRKVRFDTMGAAFTSSLVGTIRSLSINLGPETLERLPAGH